MTFPFSPISSAVTQPTAIIPAASPAPSTTPTTAAASSASVTVETMPSSPPPEVMDAIGTASQAWDRLATAGQQLRFAVDPPTGRVSVNVTDLRGTVLTTVPPSTALYVAAGGSVH